MATTVKYVCVNGPQGAGDGSSWANCWSFANAVANCVSGNLIKVRHHSLRHDGAASGLSSYAISSSLTINANGDGKNPIVWQGLKNDDAECLDGTGAASPSIDASGLASGNTVNANGYYHAFIGLSFRNGPGIGLLGNTTDSTFAIACHFKANGIYGASRLNLALGCRAENNTNLGLFGGGNGKYSRAFFNECINNGGDPTGLAGFYDQGFNYVKHSANTTAVVPAVSSYPSLCLFNTIEDLSAAPVGACINHIANYGFLMVIGNILKGAKYGVGGSTANYAVGLALFNNLYGQATASYQQTPNVNLGGTTSNPQLSSPYDTASDALLRKNPFNLNHDANAGAWQGASAGGGGSVWGAIR